MVRGRGRGRGGVRGRPGRGRGSSRGRRGRALQGGTSGTPVVDSTNDNEMGIFSTEFANDMPYDIKVRNTLIGKAEFQQHFDLQTENPTRYLAILLALDKKGIVLQQVSKNRALAAAWARKDLSLANGMLGLPDEKFNVTEVLKALTVLDSQRLKRAVGKRLLRLESQGCKKKTKIAQLRSLLGSLEKEVVEQRSTTGAVIKLVKRWTRTLPAHRLEFHALHYPPDSWKKLADICHFNPKKDFPQCPWFLPYCYGKEAPPGTIVGDVGVLTGENIIQMITDHDVDYTVVRKLCNPNNLPEECKARIAHYTEKIDTLLWYYEELQCSAVDEIVTSRLRNREELAMSYGKLMERLMTFQGQGQSGNQRQQSQSSDQECPFMEFLIPIANARLKMTELNLDSPVAVIGDMSASMDVAIRTSNIIASLLTALCNAELVFFDNRLEHPPFLPKNVEDVLKLSKLIRSRGSTSPACGLNHFYEQKKMIRTFIIVTDEEENTNYNGNNFRQLFEKYHKEIFPARLIFISFLSSQTAAGQMVSDFQSNASYINPMQFRFNRSRPDLTKLDNIFGLLSTQTELFHAEVNQIEDELLAHVQGQ